MLISRANFFVARRAQRGSAASNVRHWPSRSFSRFLSSAVRFSRHLVAAGAAVWIATLSGGSALAQELSSEIEPGRLETNFEVAQQQLPSTAEPGRIEKSFEQTPEPKSAFEPIVEEGEEVVAPEAAKAIKFNLAGIVVEGSTVYEDVDFLPLYEELLGTEISLAEIYRVANEVSAKYRGDGYILSRAIVPPQTIRNGVARVSVLEGFINEVIIEGDIVGRESLLNAYANKIAEARPLNVDVLERYLLLADDLPGVTAKAVLTPSLDMPGSSDLVIFIEHKSVDISVGGDNRGTKLQGPYQASLLIDLNSPFGLYERTRMRGTVASQPEELAFLEITHDENIGSEGTKLILSYSAARSRLGSILKPAQIDTYEDSIVLLVTHPIIRSRGTNLSVRGSFTYSRSEIQLVAGLQPLFEDRLRIAAIGGTYDFVDRLRGVNLVDVEFKQGLDILNESTSGSVDSDGNSTLSRVNGKSDFSKIVVRAQRLQGLQNLLPGLTMLVSASGQYAFSQLLSSEQFGYGGNEFGRAYDASEIVGDHGAAGTVELQYGQNVFWEDLEFLTGYQIYAFYDYGLVWRIDPLGGPSRQTGASTGAGVRFNLLDNISGFVEMAKPLTRGVASRGMDGGEPRYFFGIAARY